MSLVNAIFEDGVFRPTEPVLLPEKSKVVLDWQSVEPNEGTSPTQKKIYNILDARFESGFSDTAACHNEHQP
jgi:predicted DNA-binding antitoxin AbrB/MazE fold protein